MSARMIQAIKAEQVAETHRQRILNAAAESFLELGFERTSTAEIARRAKVSKREIYTYFADKRAILSAAITELQNDMQSKMRRIWTSSEAPGVVLPKAAKILTKYIFSEQFSKLLRIVATESYHNSHAATQFYELGPNLGRRATATYLKSQMTQGKLRKADPLSAADDFLDLVIGAQLMTAVILGQVEHAPLRRDHIKHAVEMFMKNYAI